MTSSSPTAKNNGWEARLASLETSQKNLHQDIGTLTHSLEVFAKETRDSVGALSNRIGDIQKTPWGVLGTWAAVVLAVITLAGSGYIRDMFRIEQTVDYLTKQTRDYQVNSSTIAAELKAHIQLIEAEQQKRTQSVYIVSELKAKVEYLEKALDKLSK